MIERLTIFEKIRIRKQCRRDIKLRHIDKISVPEKRKNGIKAVKKCCTPYIKKELSDFCDFRDNMLSNSPFFLHSLKPFCLFHRYGFTTAMAKLEGAFNDTKGERIRKRSEYLDRVDAWQEKYDRYIEYEANHHATHCVECVELLRKEYREITQRYFERELALVNEEIRIITSVNVRIDRRKTHCFMRLNYYINYLSNAKPKNDETLYMYTKKTYEAICGENLQDEHSGYLRAALEKRKSVIESMKTLETKGLDEHHKPKMDEASSGSAEHAEPKENTANSTNNVEPNKDSSESVNKNDLSKETMEPADKDNPDNEPSESIDAGITDGESSKSTKQLTDPADEITPSKNLQELTREDKSREDLMRTSDEIEPDAGISGLPDEIEPDIAPKEASDETRLGESTRLYSRRQISQNRNDYAE